MSAPVFLCALVAGLAPDAVAQTSVTNTATISAPANVSDPDLGNNSASDTDPVARPPVLRISKVAFLSPFIVGQPASYTLQVFNDGGVPTSAASSIVDVLPAGLLVGAPLPPGCSAAGQTVTCTFAAGLLPTNSVVFQVPVIVTAGALPSVTNTATVTGGGDPTCPADPRCSATDMNPVIGSQLTLAKVASPGFTVGQPATYTLSVTNTGTADTFGNIVVSDTIPASLTIGTLPAGCTAAGQGVTCVLTVPLAIGATADFIVPVTPTLAAGGTSVTNTASVIGGGDPTCPGVARCSASVTSPVAALPELTMLKTASVGGGDFTVGVPASYSLNVRNTGTGATTAVSTVTDTVPTELTVGAMPAGCTAAGQVVTCTVLAGLGVGAATSFTIPVTPNVAVPAPGLTNTATVSGGGDATCPADARCSSSVTTVVTAPQLFLTKIASVISFTVGVPGSYSLDVRNGGSAATTAVATVTDTIPAGFTIGTLPGACSAAGQTVTCTVPAGLAAGANTLFVIPVTPTAAAAANVTNTATVSGGGDPTCPANTARCVSQTNNDVNRPQLTLDKSASVAIFTVGQAADYTLELRNTGTAATTAVSTVTDTIPAGLTLGALPANCSAAGQTLTCTVPAGLAVNASATFVVPVTPTVAAVPGVTNTASASGGGDATCPAAARCTDSVTTAFAATTLRLAKTWAANSRNGDVASLGATSGLLNNTAPFTSTASVPANSNTVQVFAGEQALLPAETMSGAALANYDVVLACSGGSLSGTDGKVVNTLTVLESDQGNPITCTYTNVRRSTTLQLGKTWLNGYPGDSIIVSATGLSPLNSVAAGGASQTDLGAAQPVFAGDVITITESVTSITSNLYQTTLSCTNTAGLAPGGTPTEGVLTIGPGDSDPIVCTYENARRNAQLVIRKVWAGASPGASVSIAPTTGLANNTPTLVSTAPGPDQTAPVVAFAFETATLGGETFITGNPADYSRSVSCDGNDNDLSDGLTISIADAGNTVTCTYLNTFVQRAELDLQKTTPVASVTAAGEVIPYTVTATNTGNVALANVVITDPLVTNLVCTPASPVASLAVGASIDCTGSYTVTQADINRVGSGDGIDDDVIRNSATVGGTPPSGPVVVDSTTVDVALPPLTIAGSFTKTPQLDDANGSGQASVGEAISYSFTITNAGNATLSNVTIADPLLPGLSCGPSGDIQPGQTLTFGTAPPADVACTGNTYIVTQADMDDRGGGDGDIDNTATATGFGPAGGSASVSATGSVALDPPAPRLVLDKTASPGSVDSAGDVITYTFTVTNPGNVTVSDIDITDPLPGLGAITCMPAAAFDLAPGASATCTADYTVTQADIDTLGSISNTATAQGQYNGTPVSDDDSASVGIAPGSVELSLDKTADRTFVAGVGEVITYGFRVSNPSTKTFSDIALTSDSLLGAGLSCAAVPLLAPGDSVNLNCSGNTYAVTQADIDLQGLPVAGSTVVSNTATVRGNYLDGGLPAFDEASDTVNVQLPPRAPGIFLVKISDVAAITAANQVITYTFEVRNTGNVTLTDVTVSDPMLPALNCPVIASLAPSPTATLIAGCTGNQFTVTQNEIDTGSTGLLPGNGQIDNVASVTSLDPTGAAVNDIDENEVTLPARNPAMSLLKSANVASIAVPGVIEYAFTVTNTGSVTIDSLSVTDPSIGLACPSVSLAPATSLVFGGAGADVVCTNTSRSVSQAEIDTLSSIDNTAQADGVTQAGGPISRISALSVPINRNPTLALAKVADRTTVSLPGDVINYTITATNTGNLTLADVSVSDPLLGTLACTPAIPQAALAPGAVIVCTGSYAATPADFDSNGGGDQDIDNTATATWTGGSTTASASVGLPVASQSLTIDKSAGAPTVNLGADPSFTDAGDTITYTFLVTNTGNQSLSALAVTDANLDAPAVCDKSVITATGPDQTATCTGIRTLTQVDLDNGSISNSATAQGTPPASARISSAADTTNTPLPPVAVVVLDKTAGAPTTSGGSLPSATDAGDTITYSFVVSNAGNVTLSGIGVTDPLPGLPGITCPLGQLAPGASFTCSDSVYVLTQADMDAGVVANTATASGTPPVGAPATGVDSTSTTLPAVPAFTLDKSALPTTYASVGQVISYSYLVRNTGNVSLGGVAVLDDRIASVSCPGTSLAPGGNLTCTGTYTIVAADLLGTPGTVTNVATASATPAQGSLPDVSDTFTITEVPNVLDAVDDALGPVVGSVGGTTASVLGNDTLNGTVLTPASVTLAPGAAPVPPAGSLVMNADGSITVAPGTTAGAYAYPYQICEVLNPTNCDNAVATVTVGAAVILAVADNFGPVDGLVGATTPSVLANDTLNALPLVPGTFTLTPGTAPVAPSGSLSMAGDGTIVVAPLTEAGSYSYPYRICEVLNPGNCSDTVATVVVQALSGLSIDKTAGVPTGNTAGSTVSYSFLVTNTGNVTLSGLVINDAQLDAAATCASTTLAPAATTTCTGTHTITQAEVDAGVVDNSATATGTPPTGPVVTSPPDTTSTALASAPSLTVDKTAGTPSGNTAGSTVPYSFLVTNTGNVTLTGLVINDAQLDAAATCASTTLAPAATTTCTGTHTITQAEVDAGVVDNSATATGTPPTGPAVTSPPDTTSTALASAPALTVDKTAGTPSGNTAGSTVAYSFLVTNTGNVTLTGLVINDAQLDAAATCAATTLAPAATTTCTGTHTITQAEVDAGVVDNSATATGTPPTGPAVTSAPDTTSTPLAATPLLTLVKSSTTTAITAVGQSVPYTYAVTNAGSVSISAIVVTDDRIASVNCPPATLVPGASLTCLGVYLVTQADLDSGGVTNVASATGTPAQGSLTPATATLTIGATSAPALTVAKTAGVPSGNTAGSTIAYSFEVTNTGNVTLTGLLITDAQLDVAANCPATTLAPGASLICTGTHTITQAEVDAGVVDNTATATGTPPTGPAVTSAPDTTSTPLAATPLVTLVKASTTTAITAVGQSVPYTYAVTNAGSVSLTAIAVADDRIPSVSCPATALPPGASLICTGTYAVTQADLDAGGVTNTAIVTGTPAQGTLTPATATLTIGATAAPALTVDKTAGTPSGNTAGSTVPYSFLVTNTGNVTLTGLVINDAQLDAAATCPSTTLAPTTSIICTGTRTITQAEVDAGVVDNSATATGTPPTGPAVTSPPDTTSTALASAPALTVDKSAGAPSGSTAGSTVPYSFLVTNTGNVTLTGVVIDDTQLDAAATCASTTLAPAATTTCTGTHTITQAEVDTGVVDNSATATGTPPTGPAVTSPPDTTSTPLAASPQLTIVKASTTTALTALGQTVPYTYVVTNTGNVTIAAITVLDDRIASVSCPAGTLAPGASTTCTASYAVTQADLDAGGVTNIATVTGTPVQGTLAPATATLTIAATATPSLTVDKTAGAPSGNTAGSTVPYSFLVTNTGNVTLTGLVINDAQLDAAATCASTLLAPAATTTCTGTHTITQAEVDAGVVDNSATATGTPPTGPAVTSPPDTTSTVLASAPALTVDKTAGTPSGNTAGSTVPYSFLVTNTGNVTLTGLVINDAQLDAAATCAATTLAPAATTTCTGTHTLTQAEVDAGTVANTATASGSGPGGGAVVSAPSTVTTPIPAAPALSATKTATLTVDNDTPGLGNAGDVITYAVQVTNTGNVTLTALEVLDSFQGGPATLLACAPSTLAPGEVATCAAYTYTITDADVTAGGTLDNRVTAKGTANLAGTVVEVEAEAVASVRLDDTPSDLRVSKTVSPRDVRSADLVRYTVTIENRGVNAVVDATLVDTPPAGFSFVDGSLSVDDADASGRLVGTSPLRVDQIDIAAGGRANVTYLLRVGAGVRPGVHVNSARAEDGSAVSNVATAEVVLVGEPLLDEALILGTVFDDRNGNGVQDSAALEKVQIQGGFASSAYVANSTRINRGQGEQAVPDASAPLLHGLSLGTVSARQSEADPASAHQVVISQTLTRLDFADDLVLSARDGVQLRMDAAGDTTVDTGDSGAAPTLERRVSQVQAGYRVDYVLRNEAVAERGVPGVRIATVDGLLVETDAFGRFSLQGVEAGSSGRGSNFIMKVDPVTLPPGTEFTTANPLVRRVTPGLPVRMDFGARLPSGRVGGGSSLQEIEIGEVLFEAGSAKVRGEYDPVITKIADQVRAHPDTAIVIAASGESADLAYDRAKAVQSALMAVLTPEQAQALTLNLRGDLADPNSTLLSLGLQPELGQLLFDTDQARLRPEFAPLVTMLARDIEAWVKSGKPAVVSVVGHADRRGSPTHNDALGLRRAKAVYDAIAAQLSPEARAQLRVEINADPTAALPKEGPSR